MKRSMYAIRDLKAGTFNAPAIMENDAVAIRSFGDLVEDKSKGSLISLHPADFALCKVGEFDIEKGVLIPADGGFIQLAVGSDYVKGE